MIRPILYIGCIVFILCTGITGLPGCAKEYSYEGGPAPDTTVVSLPPDTIIKQPIIFPFCAQCNNTDVLLPSTWNFGYDTALICGNITDAILAPDRIGFTFFGPSSCSIDSGLVMTVYLNAGLPDADIANIVSNQVIFEYYDNVTQKDIFSTAELGTFSLTIESYVYTTGIAKGSFSGYVPAKNGDIVQIKNGRFQVKFN